MRSIVQLIRRDRTALQFDIAELAMQRDGSSADVDFVFEAIPEQIAIYFRSYQILDMFARDHFHAFALVLVSTKNRQSDRQGSFDVEFAN